QLVPVVVDFLLRVAIDYERDRLGEFELRPAVESGVGLALDLEGRRHDGAFGQRHAVSIAGNRAHLRILEYRDVELRGLFGLVVKPEKRRDLLFHATASLRLDFEGNGGKANAIATAARPIAADAMYMPV